MKLHHIQSQFTYRIDFKLYRGRKSRSELVNGSCPVYIREIDPAQAPIAYRITTLDAFGDKASCEIRSFEGSLWWPVAALGRRYFGRRHFLHLTRVWWDVATTILDPLRRTYDEPRPTIDEFHQNFRASNTGFSTTWERQAARAQNDASRVIFCANQVLVEAGEPVWYALPDEEHRDGFDFFIGHSALDRCNGPYGWNAFFWTPGPDRDARLWSARQSRAFGLGEVETGVRRLGAKSVQYKSELVAMRHREKRSAADLCAQAMSHHLWEIACLHPDLCEAIPALADAEHSRPPPDDLPYREMLTQLVSFHDPGLKGKFSSHIADADEILARWSASEGLSKDDDDAISGQAQL